MKKEDFYKTDLCVLCSSPLTRYYESVIRVTSFKCESCKLNNNYFLHSIGLSFDDSHDISIYYDKMKIFFGDYGGIYYSFKEYFEPYPSEKKSKHNITNI